MQELYQYQKDAISKALKAGSRFALFMDPGTGKTATSLGIANVLYENKKIDSIVVVAPKGVLNIVWVDEPSKWLNNEPEIFLYESESKDQVGVRAHFDNMIKSNNLTLWLYNIEAFQSPNRVMEEQFKQIINKKNALFILDESSYIKNIKAKRTIHIIRLANLFNYRIIMTGTEITKTILDLYTQFETVKKGFWNMNYYCFRNRYAVLKKRKVYKKTPSGIKEIEFNEVVRFQHVDEILDKIEPYMYRARKDDCLDLPEQIHINIPIAIDSQSRKMYEQAKKQMLLCVENGEQLTFINSSFSKLRQITGGWIITSESKYAPIAKWNAKLEYLLADIQDSSEQVIIWSVFRHELIEIHKNIEKIEPCGLFMGGQKDIERDEAIRDFQKGNIRVLVANPYACGFGLNLQNAHIMYYYSIPLSSDVLVQSQDRIHRSGQRFNCVYKYLLAKDTIDWHLKDLKDSDIKIREAFAKKDVDFLNKIL